MKDRVGKCCKCGKSAAYNTPCLDSDGRLWCDGCSDKDRSGTLFVGISQHLTEDGEYYYEHNMTNVSAIYKRNGCVLWLNDEGEPNSAWTDGGSICFRWNDDEAAICKYDFTDFLKIMEKVTVDRDTKDGTYRCSECGEWYEGKPGGFPLFSGIVCPECWDKHIEKAKNDIRCRKCGKLLSFCYC